MEISLIVTYIQMLPASKRNAIAMISKLI